MGKDVKKDKEVLLKFITICIEGRFDGHGKQFESTRKYMATYRELKKVYARMENALPAESNHTLKEYESVYYSLVAEAQHFYYRQGVVDSIHFMVGALAEEKQEGLFKLIAIFNEERYDEHANQFESLEEFKVISDKLKEIYTCIEDALPKELKHNLKRYDDAYYSLVADSHTFYYGQGFIDVMGFVMGILGEKKGVRLEVKGL